MSLGLTVSPALTAGASGRMMSSGLIVSPEPTVRYICPATVSSLVPLPSPLVPIDSSGTLSQYGLGGCVDCWSSMGVSLVSSSEGRSPARLRNVHDARRQNGFGAHACGRDTGLSAEEEEGPEVEGTEEEGDWMPEV